MSQEEKVDEAYCTFATLKSDFVDDLQALLDAIEDNGGDTTEKVVAVDKYDEYEREYDNTLEYSVPNKAIVITSMTVIKY